MQNRPAGALSWISPQGRPTRRRVDGGRGPIGGCSWLITVLPDPAVPQHSPWSAGGCGQQGLARRSSSATSVGWIPTKTTPWSPSSTRSAGWWPPSHSATTGPGIDSWRGRVAAHAAGRTTQRDHGPHPSRQPVPGHPRHRDLRGTREPSRHDPLRGHRPCHAIPARPCHRPRSGHPRGAGAAGTPHSATQRRDHRARRHPTTTRRRDHGRPRAAHPPRRRSRHGCRATVRRR